jgi:hypothetical protein
MGMATLKVNHLVECLTGRQLYQIDVPNLGRQTGKLNR